LFSWFLVFAPVAYKTLIYNHTMTGESGRAGWHSGNGRCSVRNSVATLDEMLRKISFSAESCKGIYHIN
jgi:hypothetical protein